MVIEQEEESGRQIRPQELSGEEHVKQLHIGEGRMGVVNEEFLVTVSSFLTHHMGRGLCFVLTCSI